MNLREAFQHQAISCTRLGSPFMGRLLTILADHWPADGALASYFDSFSGDIGPSGASLPLRIAGGLHALVLTDHAPALREVYPPNVPQEDMLREVVIDALALHEPFLLAWVQSPPQTNEVRRSAALMAGAAVATTYHDLPVWLSELGASGGLNLCWDHFALEAAGVRLGAADPVLTLTPEWEGAAPPATLPRIAARAGVDINPLDPTQPDDLLRLTAYLWPDQPDRLALTRAAASAAETRVERGDAIDWLAERLQAAPAGHLHLIQHTVAWQYFPAQAQALGTKTIEATGAAATPDRPLAWLSMESDGDTKGAIGAALKLRLWPGDITLSLGRADFHGRWVKWQGAA